MKYYNGCLFHTVQKDFIAQTGDPTGTGSGGDSVYKYVTVFCYNSQPNGGPDRTGVLLVSDICMENRLGFLTTRFMLI